MGLCKETPIASLLLGHHFSEEEVREMWYDWFCKETSLTNKGRSLISKLRTLYPSPRFDGKTSYVFFKNNCPLHGKLYDDFRICDIKTGDVLYCVVPKEGYDFDYGAAVVWGKHPVTGEFGELVRGSWKDIKAFFAGDDSMIEPTQRWNMIKTAEWENAKFDQDKRDLENKIAWGEAAEARASADEAKEYREQLSNLLGEQI